MSSITADKVLDNKIKVSKEVKLHQGEPDSGRNLQVLGAGRITPVVQSWVTRGGNIYWVFNELGTPYYLKHDPDFEIVEFEGGSQFLQPAKSGFDLFENFGGNLNDTINVLKKGALIAGTIYGGILAYNLYQATDPE